MKIRLAKVFLAVVACLGMVGIVVTPVFAANDVFCDQDGLTQEMKEAMGCGAGEEALPNTIKNIINAVIAVGGLVAVIYVVIGGVGYMTSQGDTSKLQKAKSTILYAAIGLVICVLAFAIVNFALTAL